MFHLKHLCLFCNTPSLWFDVEFPLKVASADVMSVFLIRNTWMCWGVQWFWQAVWPSKFNGPTCIKMLWWEAEYINQKQHISSIHRGKGETFDVTGAVLNLFFTGTWPGSNRDFACF